MNTPGQDDITNPRRNTAAGCNTLFFAIFLLLLAVVGYVAWNRNPPDVPSPSGTANPQTLPQGS
jgi:hypothetical protein